MTVAMDGVPPVGKQGERMRRMKQKIDQCVQAAIAGYTTQGTEPLIAPWAIRVWKGVCLELSASVGQP